MLRRLLLVSAVALCACPGLPLDAGNAYPCDFSQPPSERDTVCVAGDVCGIDNRCRHYFYEGPRFEGEPSQAVYDAGEKVHPLVLAHPPTLLATDPTGRGPLLVRRGAASHLVSPRGQVAPGPSVTPEVDALTWFEVLGTGAFAVGLKKDPLLPGSRVLATTLPGLAPAALRGLNSVLLAELNFQGRPGPARVERLRVQPTVPPVVQLITPTGEPQRVVSGLTGAMTVADYPVLTDAGLSGALDLTVVNRGAQRPATVALLRGSLQLEQPDGGFVVVDAPSGLPTAVGALRVNRASTLLTVLRDGLALSTWQVAVTNGAQTLQSAWPDCRPCPGLALVAAPVPPEEGVAVEVLCTTALSPSARLSLFKVTGSQAAEPTDRCLVEPLTLPIDPTEIALGTGGIVATTEQRFFNVAGKSGQVWRGETPSRLLPIALERVPLDATTVRTSTPLGEYVSLAAITDRYLAVRQAADAGQVVNGFRRIDLAEEFGATDLPPLTAVVHGTPGWGVLQSGVAVRFETSDFDARDAGESLRFGPRFVTPSGEPVRDVLGGEAYLGADGSVTSFFVAADDGLYFVPSPRNELVEDQPTGSGDITPQLQPEPSVPIRSFALERTPLGTDGVTKARGYLVTSRNLFEWSLGGTPARWSSTPLVLAGGEPVEVWFDKPRSALGRVGYTSGQIFTLPGGYQLAESLPGGDGGVVRVLDYENVGGWPAALATTGLFIAGWPLVDGKLQNKFDDGRPNKPMSWSEIWLPDGGRPWIGPTGQVQEGKLHVTLEPQPDGKQLFTLFVFLDRGVWVVATHLRKP